MNDEEILTLVQSLIIQNKFGASVLLEKANDLSGIARYKTITAYRMVLNYTYYKKRYISKYDFEVSLRNYLLVMNTSIFIPDFCVELNDPFGLFQDNKDGKIVVNYELPSYLNAELIRQAYLNGYEEKEENTKYDLSVNSYIRDLTGFKKFKSIEQKLSVIGALKTPNGYTCMISMSTGSGKSLITQTVSYQKKNGLSIIVVPTISLMLDQERNAKAIINSDVKNEIYSYYSGTETNEFIDSLKSRKARMLFISPEALLKNQRLRDAIFEANRQGYINNLIIDEAHIVVEWGISFRIDFQCLDSLRKNLLKDNPDIKTFLLSATFSKDTADQLKHFFSDNNRWIEIRCDSLRKELRYDIIEAKKEKNKKAIDLICKLPRPMIVYVRRPEEAERLSKKLKDFGFDNLDIFTGKTSNNKRNDLIKKWSENKLDLMIATCAFGLGVDKEDIRTVLHLYIPENANKYYQEAGRGGRDGLPSLSVMLYNDNDLNNTFSYTQKTLTVDKFIGRWFSMLKSHKTVRNNGVVILDTSIRPDYNSDDEYFYETSNADVDWNVNVILMLRKNDLIEIADVIYTDNKYLFSVLVNDKRLLERNEEANILFEDIRNREVEYCVKEYTIIKKSLSHLRHDCWCEMFNEVYDFTVERCSGCNSHNDIIDAEKIDRPLKKRIKESFKETENKIFENSSDIIIVYNDISDIFNKLVSNDFDLIVVPDDFKVTDNLLNHSQNVHQHFLNYSEFMYLMNEENYYYISGSAAIIYSDGVHNSNIIDRLLYSVQILKSRNDLIKFLHVIKNDFAIAKTGKRVSEILDANFETENLLDRS